MKNLILLSLISQIIFSQTSDVTFSKDISPIIYGKCTSCHREGESGQIPFTSYLEVASMGEMIKVVTQSNYMPPWPPDPEYTPHSLLDERFLTDDEKNLIVEWVDNGLLQGNPELEAELPTTIEGSVIGEPDYVFQMNEAYFIEGNNMDDYRVFVFPTGFTEDTYIKSIEFRPDNREAVHHAIIMADVTGSGASNDEESPDVLGYESFGGFSLDGVSPTEYVFLAGYAPGMNPIVWNGELGMKIPAGADILCQVHYAPSSVDEWDQSSINIFTKPASEVEREVQMKMWLRLDLDIPANTQTTVEACLNFHPVIPYLDFFGPEPQSFNGYTFTGEQHCSLPEDWSLLGILPHSHLMGKSWEVYAETPDGNNIPIIKIPDWDFDWQGFYYPEYMQHIPAGSIIKGIATYDNTSDQNMSWGELTTDEMFFCPIYYVPYQDGDENIYLGIDNEINQIEEKSHKISVFPNPSSDFIEVQLKPYHNEFLKVDILDSKGRIIKVPFDYNIKTESNNLKINIKDLDLGVYFLQIYLDNIIVSESFVKNNQR
ncbi:MAG: hypothetical protein CMP65_04465 [Flavobacteriales bacterium]|nr:hypothetical protein [Flavobacteriales bacterium]|tara:strand:- start:14436 stop:16064 length:1629 start_codon:yes stop_codon:yes gene_type:complete